MMAGRPGRAGLFLPPGRRWSLARAGRVAPVGGAPSRRCRAHPRAGPSTPASGAAARTLTAASRPRSTPGAAFFC